MLYKSAPLHDIGKIDIRDHILLKPGSLDPAERREMHSHAVLGFETLDQAEQQAFSQSDSSFLAMAKQIAKRYQPIVKEVKRTSAPSSPEVPYLVYPALNPFTLPHFPNGRPAHPVGVKPKPFK